MERSLDQPNTTSIRLMQIHYHGKSSIIIKSKTVFLVVQSLFMVSALYYSGRLAALTGKRMPIVGIRLHPEFPYIEAEVRYAVKEYAATAIDIVARRLR